MSEQESDAQLAEDDRCRMLKHSQKVRDTLDSFPHRDRQAACRDDRITDAGVVPEVVAQIGANNRVDDQSGNIRSTLYGQDGKPLPFDRLSAGERQLLATSMLWGLARASGRPVPTIIDTPLGRLDSNHRANLVERYFPNASHQVLLLSTDEEIVGGYLKKIMPFVSRTFLLDHNQILGETRIKEGYFSS